MKTLNLILALLLIPAFATAQNTTAWTIDASKSSMVIHGGSTVGSWEAAVTQINAEFQVDDEALAGNEENGSFITLKSFKIPVKGIDSDGNRMNRNIYKYLEESNHPNILFRFNSADFTANAESNGTRFNSTVNGTINAAGADHNVVINSVVELLENGTIRISGMQELNFSDFNIDRPSAMLGTVRASEELEIHFDLILVKK